MANFSKNLLLGISGGIGAYKSAELVRLLSTAGFKTKVVITEAAKSFITPLTLQTLSGFPVYDSLWNSDENPMNHIELAKWADLIVIAPATVNCIAKLAFGLADDLLSTIYLASAAPLIIVPAMNQAMWHHPATQANVQTLKERNVHFLGPEEGIQACGDIGLGRMQEPMHIVENIQRYINDSSELPFFNNKFIVITAGPTQEAIDPVRYISNHSSGKMGYALAQAAQETGAQVLLISGPTTLNCPKGVKCIKIKTAEEMLNAVMAHAEKMDIFISTAAVADYRPETQFIQKFKKNAHGSKITITLIKNPDILSEVASLKTKPVIVGFAAETENLLEYARQKMTKKKLDLIVANLINTQTGGFNSDENNGWILTPNETIEIPVMSKLDMAKKILKSINNTIQQRQIKK